MEGFSGSIWKAILASKARLVATFPDATAAYLGASAEALTKLPRFRALVGVLFAGLLALGQLGRKPWPRLARLTRWPFATRAALSWIVTAVFCWAAVFNVHRFSRVSGLPDTPAGVLLAGLLCAVPVSLLAHQFGHWLAGRTVALAGVWSWSGWADPQPAALNEYRLNSRLFVWTLGGPLASLTLGASLLFLFVSSPSSPWADLGELMGLSAACSLAVFLISLLPWRSRGHRSDGAALLAILRRGPEYRRDRALALAAGEWQSGVAPRNWNPYYLRVAASTPDGSPQHASGCALNYLYSMDRAFAASARFWIGRLTAEFGQDMMSVPVRWRLEVAYHLATYGCSGRVRDAESWRHPAGPGHRAPRSVRLRCDAALALLNGRHQAAAEMIFAAEQTILRHRLGPASEFELDLLGHLRDRIEPALVATSLTPQPVMSLGAV